MSFFQFTRSKPAEPMTPEQQLHSETVMMRGFFKWWGGSDEFRRYRELEKLLPKTERPHPIHCEGGHKIINWFEDHEWTAGEESDVALHMCCNCEGLNVVIRATPRKLRDMHMYGFHNPDNPLVEELRQAHAAVIAHLNEVLRPYNPTLQDFTDWGWFNPEAT